MKLKIQALGNGTGRPVNVHAVWDEQLNEMRPTSGRKQQFFKDNPALPLYLNGEPYMGFDVVEGGRVWQSRMKSQLSWETHDTDVKSISHGSLIETREIYRITPSAPDNDKKVAEAGDGREFKGTPGKWEVGLTASQNKCSIWVGASRIAIIDEFPHVGSKANARLIAAAPELLEALQVLLAAYQSDGTEDFYNLDPVELAKSAINKALGTI